MRRRKNFLPTLLLTTLFWLFWFYIFFFVSPQNTTYHIPHIIYFFTTLFVALTLTLALLFGNTRRGFLITLGIIGFLILRMYDLAHYLNLVLLIGFLISLEFCFSKR